MRHFLKHISLRFAVSITLSIIMSAAFVCCTGNRQEECKDTQRDISSHYRSKVHSLFQSKARRYNADTRFLIIVDYSIPSNRSRLFLWDTEQDGIVEQFWCAHGRGGNSTAERPEFSNEIGSNCSSLGWFLVDRYSGVSPSWGYTYYAVDGLDPTNSNARVRQILIHPWSSVSNDEAAQIDEPMGLDGRCLGCFTTSDKGFKAVEKCIKSRSKHLLLWAIDGIE